MNRLRIFLSLGAAAAAAGLVTISCLGVPSPTSSNNPSGTCANTNITAKVDGASFQSCNVITTMAPNLYVMIQAQSDGAGTPNFTQISLQIPATAFAAGTYNMGHMDLVGTTANGGVGTGTLPVSVYQTDSTTHTGTYTITAYDAVAKRISGTFSFTGVQTTPTPSAQTMSVTQGVFTNITWP